MDLLTSAALFAAASSSKTSSGSSSSFFIFLALLVVVFWFAVIRPQRNRQRAQQQATSQIAPGDEVVTVGGLVATVVELVDDRVVLLVSPGVPDGDGGGAQPVEMTFLRQSVARKIASPADTGSGSPEGVDEPDEEADLPDEPDSGQ